MTINMERNYLNIKVQRWRMRLLCGTLYTVTCSTLCILTKQEALIKIHKTDHKIHFTLGANSYMFRNQGTIFNPLPPNDLYIQGDSFGTRPKKIRMSQRLFIRF